jgi:hypothetical protein
LWHRRHFDISSRFGKPSASIARCTGEEFGGYPLRVRQLSRVIAVPACAVSRTFTTFIAIFLFKDPDNFR